MTVLSLVVGTDSGPNAEGRLTSTFVPGAAASDGRGEQTASAAAATALNTLLFMMPTV